MKKFSQLSATAGGYLMAKVAAAIILTMIACYGLDLSFCGSSSAQGDYIGATRNPGFLFLADTYFDPTTGTLPDVQIGNARLETTNHTARVARMAAGTLKLQAQKNAYYIVQFTEAPTEEMTKGLDMVAYVPNNAYIVRASMGATPHAASHVRWTGAYGAGLKLDAGVIKLSKALLNNPDEGETPYLVAITGFRGEDPEFLTAQIQEAASVNARLEGGPVSNPFGVAVISGHSLPAAVAAMAGIEGIQAIELRQPAKLDNDNEVKIIQCSDCLSTGDTPLYRHGLTGAGQVYGAADSGLDDDGTSFKLTSAAPSQTLHFATSLTDLVGGLLPVLITDPTNKIKTYYLIGAGGFVVDAPNPNGGRTLNPTQTSGGSFINAVAYDDSAAGYHGTATTSVAVGRDFAADGSGSVPGIPGRTSGDGIAPDSRVIFQDIGHTSSSLPGADFVNSQYLFLQAYASGARSHNNSYGLGGHTSYGSFEANEDVAAWYLRDLTIVFSAGNSGPGAGTLGNTSKNPILVGATQSPTFPGGDINNVASFSSHGNAGRIKPDIVAPGQVFAATELNGIPSPYGSIRTSRTALDAGINPSSPNNLRTFGLTQGTSFSAPAIAGSTLLVRQYFTDGFYPGGSAGSGTAFSPSNALTKAIVINSGKNLTGLNTAGNLPSVGQGWGRVSLDDSLFFTGDTRKLVVLADIYNGATVADGGRPAKNPALTTGGNHVYRIGVVDTTQPVRFTLAWTDPNAAVGAGVALVNNLDLEITDPSGVAYRGNVNFSGGFSTPAGATPFDNLNTVEGVYIATPQKGVYTIKVTGASVPGNGLSGVIAQPGNQSINSNRQGYALVATGDVKELPANTSATVDSASYQRKLAPGQIASVFGAGLPTMTASGEAIGDGLPITLENLQVKVDGIFAPLFFAGINGTAGSYQINLQVPYETALGTALIEVFYQGSLLAAETGTVFRSGPAVFTFSSTGVGQAAALNIPDYSPNGSGNAIARGGVVVVYATGGGGIFVDDAGAPLPVPTSGNSAPPSPLYHVGLGNSATIGGLPATVSFLGLAPGYVGLLQANIIVPTGVSVGPAIPLVFTIDGRVSVATTIAIKP